MRPPATVLGAGLSAVAAVLLLTGCGGSDEEPTAPASSSAPATGSSTAAAPSSSTTAPGGSSAAPSSSTTAPAGGAEPEVASFCTDTEAAFTRVGQAFGSVTDPAAVPAALDEGAAALAEVDPPAEIVDAWAAIQDGLARLREAVAAADVSTPAGAASLQGAIGTFQTETAAPQQAIEQYLAANCGDLAVGGAPAAPTS